MVLVYSRVDGTLEGQTKEPREKYWSPGALFLLKSTNQINTLCSFSTEQDEIIKWQRRRLIGAIIYMYKRMLPIEK